MRAIERGASCVRVTIGYAFACAVLCGGLVAPVVAWAIPPLIPTGEWVVTREAGVSSLPTCVAKNTFAWLPSGLSFSVVMSVEGAGVVTLFFDLVRPLPVWWQARLGPDGEEWVATRYRVGLDDAAPFEVEGRERGRHQELRFTAGQHFVERVVLADRMTFGTVTATQPMVLSIPNHASLANGLSACLGIHGIPAVHAALDAGNPASTIPGRPPLVELHEATMAMEAAQRSGPNGKAWASSALRLGLVQARITQWAQARTTFQTLLDRSASTPVDPAISAEAARQLSIALLHLERPDDAFRVAEGSTRSEIEALADLQRGSLEEGESRLSALLRADLDLSASRPLRLSAQGLAERCPLRSGATRAAIRRRLLAWADATAGEEYWLDNASPVRYLNDVGSRSPAYVVANAALGCIGPGALLADAADGDAWRDDQAEAALARAASLRRSNVLRAGSPDLAYARYLFARSRTGSIGLLRVQLEQARLDADLGRDGRALASALRLSRDMVDTLGEDSMLAIEAATLVARMQLRFDQSAEALATARRALIAAARALQPAHSDVLLLQRVAIEAELALGDRDGATETLKAALVATTRSDADIAAGRARPAVVARIERLRLFLVARRMEPVEDASSKKAIEGLYADEIALIRSNGGRFLTGGFGGVTDLLGLVRSFDDAMSTVTRSTLIGYGHVSPTDKMLDAAANRWLDVRAALPTEMLTEVAAGEDTATVERTFAAYRGAPQTTTLMSERIDLELALAQALTRGEVFAQVAMRQLAQNKFGNDAIAARALANNAEELRRRRRVRALIEQATSASTSYDPRLVRRYLDATIDVSDAANDAYQAFNGDSAAIFKGVATGGYFGLSVEAKDFRKSLAPGEAVVVWIPMERSTDVIVITPTASSLKTVPLGRPALASMIATLRSAIDRAQARIAQHDAVAADDFPVEVSRQLCRALFGSIDEDLASTKHLYTAQLGPIGDLPLALLARNGDTSSGATEWLTDRYAITRMPALLNPSAFANDHATSYRHDTELLAFGDPSTGSGSIDGSSAARSDGDADGDEAADLAGLPALPNAAIEARTVARILEVTDVNASVFLAKRSTPDEVMVQLAQRRLSVLLFSTHGLTGSSVLGEPSLVLGPASAIGASRGRLLSASTISGLDFDVDLAILSACSTTVTADDSAEPLAGLSAAFLSAGAHEVLATYWTLYDNLAPQLIGDVVQGRFSDHKGTAESLQQATRELRRGSGNASGNLHPVYWASFEVLGFPRVAAAVDGKAKRPVDPGPVVAAAAPAAPSTSTTAQPPALREISARIDRGIAAARAGRCDVSTATARSIGEDWPKVFPANIRNPAENDLRTRVFELIGWDRQCRVLNPSQQTSMPP